MKRLSLFTIALLTVSLCSAQKKNEFCICITKKEAKKVIREIKDSTWQWNLKYPESTTSLITNGDMCIGLYLVTYKSNENKMITFPLIRMENILIIQSSTLEKNLSVLDKFKSLYKNTFTASEIMKIEKEFLSPVKITGAM